MSQLISQSEDREMWNQEDLNCRLRRGLDGDLHRSVLFVPRDIEHEFDRCMCLRNVLR